MERRCRAWSKSASPTQLQLEQFVEPQEQVMAPEVRDCIECLRVETEAAAIHTALIFRWNN